MNDNISRSESDTAPGARLKALINSPDITIAPGIYDGFSARLVEKMGFKTGAISGAGTSESRLGWADRGLMGFEENLDNARRIADCTGLLLQADADTGYGNAVNVYFVVRAFEKAGMAAVMIEDQVWPKRCGHMAGKSVVPAEEMVAKIKAAVGARQSKDFFIIARTDARAVHGLDEALRRGEMYLEAGVDGLFIEAPQTVAELERVGRAFPGVPQIANMLEGGGQTPFLPPRQLKQMGFAMAAYPTTLLFRVARTIERALADIRAGRPLDGGDGVNFAEFKSITNYDEWARIEGEYAPGRGTAS